MKENSINKKNALKRASYIVNNCQSEFYVYTTCLSGQAKYLHFEVINIFWMTVIDKTYSGNIFSPAFTNKYIG